MNRAEDGLQAAEHAAGKGYNGPEGPEEVRREIRRDAPP